MERNIGGERVGSGNKQKVYLHGYGRSNHDLSYVWRSTMSAGTLVPFMSEVMLPGDQFKIDLNADVLTHPTIGPLFGSYKVQLDVFTCPIRLYNGDLHMNRKNVGMKIRNVKLPQVRLSTDGKVNISNIDNEQINSSCIFSYLNIRGLGSPSPLTLEGEELDRTFNAVSWLAYWDIYAQYYANKMEEVGAVIHNDFGAATAVIEEINYETQLAGTLVTGTYTELNFGDPIPTNTAKPLEATTKVIVQFDPLNYERISLDRLKLLTNQTGFTNYVWMDADDLFQTAEWDDANNRLTLSNPYYTSGDLVNINLYYIYDQTRLEGELVEPKINFFPLTNIDEMRERILKHTGSTSEFLITETEPLTPYNLPLQREANPDNINRKFRALRSNQEGLALKTYQSDLFNNWITTEWISGGEDSISDITKIDVSAGSFTIDELNLSQKVYNMLNRIAVSGGSYEDWIEVTYDEERYRTQENPAYVGGLIKELVFQEVVSNAATSEQPLGTLAGRGVLSKKHKGGEIDIRVSEPSYVMGIVSLTPRLDYSQGNKWDVNLKTLDDLHKPALDAIGFQDLITDQMAWFDTRLDNAGNPVFKSAGKQPAWINYMTNVNQVRGNFAVQTDQMFMTLNRRYEPELLEDNAVGLKDLTTYIDPAKFNHIFAYTRRDGQNFWVQIGVGIEARRKMSAKVIPNL